VIRGHQSYPMLRNGCCLVKKRNAAPNRFNDAPVGVAVGCGPAHSKGFPMPTRLRFLLIVASLASLSLVHSKAQEAPPQLKPPDNERLLLKVHAKGDQIYSCASMNGQFAWNFKAPDAQLFDDDGKLFGKHFAGPSWEISDGSKVVGKLAVNSPSPDADSIPWLLLRVVDHSGPAGGRLSPVTSIQRLNTKGGKAPANGCDAAHDGQEVRVPYSADYYFYGPK